MAREPSLQQTLNDGIEHHMENYHFCLPGIVLRVDIENQQVDVQPSLSMKLFDGSGAVERPAILNVPLMFPSSRTSGFTFPVRNGDSVLLVFSERGLDSWKKGNGYTVQPTDFRMFDYKDAIAIPGLTPSSRSITSPARHVLTHDPMDTVMFTNIGGTESEVRLKVDGSIEINTSNQPVIINCSDATVNASSSINLNASTATIDIGESVWIGNITLQGNLTQVGNYVLTGQATFNGIPFSTHRHLGVQTGSGTSGGPTA